MNNNLLFSFIKKTLSVIFTMLIIACAFTAMKKTAFADTEGDYEYSSYVGGIRIDNYTGSETAVTIPSTLGGETVTELFGAFQNNTTIKSVVIPKSVTSINQSTFDGCTNLTDVTFGGKEEYIGGFAFQKCSSLKTLNIPETVTTIDDFAFSGCSGLTAFNVPDNVTEIGQFAFEYCSSLTKVTFGKKLNKIGEYAFFDLKNLNSINIPDSVTSIEDAAFSGCENLTEVNLGKGVTHIGDGAFGGCGFKELVIPDSVTQLDASAIINCKNLKKITIGSGLKQVGDGSSSIISSCYNVETIIIKEGVESLEAFSLNESTNLKNVTIPDSVTSIDKYNTFDYQSDSFVITASCDHPLIADLIANSNRKWNKIHKYDTGVVLKEATCTENGLMFYKCTAVGCGETNTEVVYALGHDFAMDTEYCKRGCGTKNPYYVSPAVNKENNSSNISGASTNQTDNSAIGGSTFDAVAKSVTLKLKKIKKKDQKIKAAITVSGATGKVSYAIVKKGTAAKIRKLVKINNKGVITFKKWKKAKKGTYKIKVDVTAEVNGFYDKVVKSVTVKVKLK